MPVVFGGSSKIVSFKTNNVNTQILGFLLNVSSSYAKIRVHDPLLVYFDAGPKMSVSEVCRYNDLLLHQYLSDFIPITW